VTAILLPGGLSMVIAMLGTRLAITVLRKRELGQQVRSDGPQAHLSKSGTPTMGGIVIIAASLIGYVAGHLFTGDPMTASGVLVLFLMAGLGLVGFADDFIKLFRRRSLGLRSGAKLAAQAAVGAIFAILALRFPDSYDFTPASPHLSFLADFGILISPVLVVAWVIVMVTGTSNAVNLTDGLDGLASGAAIMVLVVYVIIGDWQYRNDCITALTSGCSDVRDPGTWRWSPRPWQAPASASCGGTRRPPGSSWAIPARSPSGARWPAWPSSPGPNCCCSCSAACS
jgi:phospho-N-acetylmuramoyl-pentapeptide-transferase